MRISVMLNIFILVILLLPLHYVPDIYYDTSIVNIIGIENVA